MHPSDRVMHIGGVPTPTKTYECPWRKLKLIMKVPMPYQHFKTVQNCIQIKEEIKYDA